jgi:hypothetical protein
MEIHQLSALTCFYSVTHIKMKLTIERMDVKQHFNYMLDYNFNDF